MNRFHRSPYFIAIFCFFFVSLHAQPEHCLGFDDLPADARYGRDGGHQPGDLAFKSEGVGVYLEEFIYDSNIEPGFWNADVRDNLFGEQAAIDGPFLFVSNINLRFDFTTLDRDVGMVCFSIVDGGGEENISVNGEPVLVINRFEDAPQEIAPGVTLVWEYLDGPNPNNLPNIRVCVRGNIETLVIGGQELGLDNVCYLTLPTCRLKDLKAEIVNCYTTSALAFNVYDIALNFATQDADNVGFDVFINDAFHSFHAYEELPLLLKEVRVASGTEYFTLTVCENDNPDCCSSIDLLNEGCPSDCRLEEFDITQIECTASGQYWARFRAKGNNLSGSLTITNASGETWTGPADGSQPVKFTAPSGQHYDRWEICDSQQPNCCKVVEFELPCKPCRIGPLQVKRTECSDDGTFYFILDFEHQTPTGQFYLYLNQEKYGAFAYQHLPLQIGPLKADPTLPWHLLVRDVSELCAEDISLEPVKCGDNVCRIGELHLSEPRCTDDGKFFFKLDFEHKNTSETFELLLNGQSYDQYAYTELPVTVGPLPLTNLGQWKVLVKDQAADCAAEGKIETGDCHPVCRIGPLNFSDIRCTDDGQFFFKLNFEHKNTAERFGLFLNGELYDDYAYSDLPIVIGPLSQTPTTAWKVLVKDRSGLCAEDGMVGPVDCGGGDCQLSGLTIERHPCIGGQFWIDIAFEAKHPGSQGYYVFADGQISGPHSYDQPYITLGPFAGDGTTIYDFLIIDIADPSCYLYHELGPVDCSEPCTITDVIAEAHDCNDDGSFLVDIAFDFDKVGAKGFTIRGNGQVYGSFDYGKPFYTVGPVKGDGQTAYEFVIIDNEKEDCRAFTSLEAVDCTPCKIGELEYGIACRPDSPTFVLELDFEHQHTAGERFRLSSGDHLLGTFPYADLPLRLELELPQHGELPLRVCDSEDENCCRETVIKVPCCSLSDLVVEALPCEQDGELWLHLDVNSHNVSGSFQLVYGPQAGPLRTSMHDYDELPLSLGPLPGQRATTWFFEITDASYYCQTSTTYEVPYCDNDACAEWEETDAGAYGPLTAYQPGQQISNEDGIRLSFAGANPANCGCSVFVLNATTIPAFSSAAGQMVLMSNSAATLDFPEHEVSYLQLDYFFDGNQVSLSVNDQAPATANHPLQLPADIAPGVNLSVTSLTTDGRQGVLTLSGDISALTMYARGRWAFDNVCVEKTEKEDEIWPGDTNQDNIANHVDLLNIGIAFGLQGPVRDNANINWSAQFAEDWPQLFFEDGLNYKHADTNGDGQIDRDDRGPIMENYGLTHGPTAPVAVLPAQDDDPPLFVDFASAGSIPAGGTFQAPIVLGTEDKPVEGLYGIAFTITFDPEVIKPESIEVVYPASWLGDTDEDIITLDRRRAESGAIDIAISRIDLLNVGGFGPIASLIGAIDDIAGKHTTVGVTDVVAINAGEERLPVNPQITEVEFAEGIQPDIGYIDLNRSLNIFPNPTSGEVLVTTKFNFPILGIRVLDGYGNPTGLQVTGKNRIDLQSLPAGVYCLRIRLSEYTISRKIIKVQR